MIWIDDEDDPNGFPHPPGLSFKEATELGCEFWTPAEGSPWATTLDGKPVPGVGLERSFGCRGFGHYLCGECSSLERDEEDGKDGRNWIGT